MASPKELRAAIIENRAQLQFALHSAGAKWEAKPAAGEGEETWSPKEVVRHMIGSEWFFTNGIAQACGAPALDRATVVVGNPADAAGTATRNGATCDNILRHVSEGDLSKSFEMGQLGNLSVEQMLTIMDSHARDHLIQLQAASGA